MKPSWKKLLAVLFASLVAGAFSGPQCRCQPVSKCNAGNGNASETTPETDCDPGNSGATTTAGD